MSEKKIQNHANVFIIDDEELVAAVLKLYLEKGGYKNVHVFTDSVEAMETLSFVKADVILTDVDMPELSGKFLTRLARKTAHLENTPIIVVTSDDSEATRKNLIGNGVDAILHKPVDCDLLLETVNRSLKNRRAEIAAEKPSFLKERMIEKEQRRVVLLASEGVPNKSIARRLDVSVKTVEKSRRNAYNKLLVNSSAEVASLVTFGRFFVDSPSSDVSSTNHFQPSMPTITNNPMLS